MTTAVSIRLERAEGLIPLPAPVTLTGPAVWEQADRVLRGWARTAPTVAEGGYDKTDFLVTWPDGETYEGRFDLVADEEINLVAHVNGFLDWIAAHPDLDRDLPTPAEIALWRDAYEIGDPR